MSSLESVSVDQISRVLAVLIAENESYSYVDKLSYVVSPDLAVYYLREALRDFSSLMNKERWENSRARSEAGEIDMARVEEEINRIAELRDPKEVRRVVSLISAKALARANSLRKREEGEK